MRNAIMMTAAVTLSLGSVSAQKITFSGSDAMYLLRGCAFNEEGLQCDLTFTPGQDRNYAFSVSDFHVVTPDGVPVRANKVKVAGSRWDPNYVNSVTSYKGVGYQVSLMFNVPRTTRSLAVFSAEGSTLRNVTIGGAATTPAPTPSAPTLTFPNTQAVIGGKAFTISFNNCAVSTNGTFTCRSVLAPAR